LVSSAYVIVYRLKEDAAEILYICHGAQDWLAVKLKPAGAKALRLRYGFLGRESFVARTKRTQTILLSDCAGCIRPSPAPQPARRSASCSSDLR
jgi:hypothetical protein